MVRSTSSETLAMRAMPAISVSVIFGLLRTAAVTIRLGSRIRMARSSRVPFIARAIRLATFRPAMRCSVDSSRSSAGGGGSSAAGVHQRQVASPLGAAAGVIPRAAK